MTGPAPRAAVPPGLADAEIGTLIAGIRHEAFRLELQPWYDEAGEAAQVDRFLAGDPVPPEENPDLVAWCEIVAGHMSQGRRVRRVRVQEEPPTGYQRWLQWLGRWNIAAGEDIRYLTRSRAREIGLLAAGRDGRQDWWLLDSATLVVLSFDEQGRRVGTELETHPDRAARACAWRDLAVRHSVPDVRGVPELKGLRGPASGVADPPPGPLDPPA